MKLSTTSNMLSLLLIWQTKVKVLLFYQFLSSLCSKISVLKYLNFKILSLTIKEERLPKQTQVCWSHLDSSVGCSQHLLPADHLLQQTTLPVHLLLLPEPLPATSTISRPNNKDHQLHLLNQNRQRYVTMSSTNQALILNSLICEDEGRFFSTIH